MMLYNNNIKHDGIFDTTFWKFPPYFFPNSGNNLASSKKLTFENIYLSLCN